MSGVNTSLPVRQMIDCWMLTAVMALVIIRLALGNRLVQLKGRLRSSEGMRGEDEGGRGVNGEDEGHLWDWNC